jgi:hypothetical protein
MSGVRVDGQADEDIDAVIELERRLLRADVRASSSALDALLDPDFFEFGASGSVLDR